MADLPLRRFEDLPGRYDVPGKPDLPGRSAEAQAADFYLERRGGPGHRSTSDPDRFTGARGQVHPTYDVDATVRRIELALREIPESWVGVVLVHLAWGRGVRQLQNKTPEDGRLPVLERAGFPTELPRGFGRYGLSAHGLSFRVALAQVGLIPVRAESRDTINEDHEAAELAVTWEQRMEADDWIIGWDAIAECLGVSVDTAQSWLQRRRLPVTQPGGPRGHVRAKRTDLLDWLDRRRSGVTA